MTFIYSAYKLAGNYVTDSH